VNRGDKLNRTVGQPNKEATMRLFNTKAPKSSARSSTPNGRKTGSSRDSMFEALENRQMFATTLIQSHLPLIYHPPVSAQEKAINAEYAHTKTEMDASGHSVQSDLGKATSTIKSAPGFAGAYMQTYHDNGIIFWSAKTGAHVVYGDIGWSYHEYAHSTDPISGKTVQQVLGLPMNDEKMTDEYVSGFCGWSSVESQTFQGGQIVSGGYYEAPVDAVYGAINTLYNSLGGVGWGIPCSDVSEGYNSKGDLNGVFTQSFDSTDLTSASWGLITWSKAHGAHATTGI
jgi:hypothetical protein